MGGTGGYFSRKTNPLDLRQQVRNAENLALNDEFDYQVSDIINSQLVEINQRDAPKLNDQLDRIKSALEKEIEGDIRLMFGGSVKKHTYVDGLSDIDALLILNQTELKNKEPKDVRSYFAQRLRERFPKNEVTEGTLSVKITIDGNEIQLLPALRYGKGLRIIGSDGYSWSQIIRPDRFAEKLTSINQQTGSKTIPTVKMVKSILAQFPSKLQLTGYHIESLAVKAFRDYEGQLTTKALLRHFFEYARSGVLTPISDSSGQSLHVDDYLGAANSSRRKAISEAIGRVHREIQNADGAKSVEQWKSILGE